MPQLGETVTEGTLTVWHKKPGDWVEANELLFEVSTDKVDTEIPAPASGTLVEVLVDEGVTVDVGTRLGVIQADGEEAIAPSGRTEAPPPLSAPASRAAARDQSAPPPPLSPVVGCWRSMGWRQPASPAPGQVGGSSARMFTPILPG